jgi:heterodisulfide reductase subunit C
MSEPLRNQDDTVAVDIELWREESAELADYWSSFCYTCNACASECPAAKHGEGFNPRDIVLKARFGLGDKLLLRESIIRQCFRCYRCCDRCPQEIKPVEVIAWLKEMLKEIEMLSPHS